MINLYPGPSKLNPSVFNFLSYLPDVVTMNHRSDAFMDLYRSVKDKFFRKFDVPNDYELAFVSSATECWEIIAQSYTNIPFQHFSNGAFGDKWQQVSSTLGRENSLTCFGLNDTPLVNESNDKSIICLTHCETSNGTYLDRSIISSFRNKNPNSLIAVDATSSLGGIYLDFSETDIVFASVQKCLGLPAGLGILILSPNAVKEAKLNNIKKHYNDINSIVNNAINFQTTHTPNILSVYLLNNLLAVIDNPKVTEKRLKLRLENIRQLYKVDFLSSNVETQSPTVFAIKHNTPDYVLKCCQQKNIILGKGYGKWKETSYRIANFPAHTLDDIYEAFKVISTI